MDHHSYLFFANSHMCMRTPCCATFVAYEVLSSEYALLQAVRKFTEDEKNRSAMCVSAARSSEIFRGAMNLASNTAAVAWTLRSSVAAIQR